MAHFGVIATVSAHRYCHSSDERDVSTRRLSASRELLLSDCVIANADRSGGRIRVERTGVRVGAGVPAGAVLLKTSARCLELFGHKLELF